MKKLSAFLLAVVIYVSVHEGMHALVAVHYDEFAALHWQILGPEVTYRTPVGEREGILWAVISGAGNIITILSGYLLLAFGGRFARLHSLSLKATLFYLTVVFLIADPLNLSLGPFIYGGDANGIAAGLGINRYVIQIIFLLVFLVNRELVIRCLFPVYEVKVRHILFRPWILICTILTLYLVSCNLFDTDETMGSSANLRALTIFKGTLTPPFASNITQYILTFSSYPRSFEMIAEAEDSAATILVNGVTVPSGQWYQVHTSPPGFVVNITVISANRKNSKTYVLQLPDS